MNSETRMPASRRRGDHRLQVVVLAGRVEPALGRPFLALLGHDAGGMGAVAQRDADHLLGRGHLEVERHLELAHQAFNVAVDDVPAILAQMGGDAVGAAASAMRAARSGSGSLPPRALRTVAT